VHGLRGRDLLTDGWTPERVARRLNDTLGPAGIAWCDGRPYDSHWMGALFRAGGRAPCFVLGHWHRLASMFGKAEREAAFDRLERQPIHRARADAEQLLLALTLAHTADGKVGPVRELDRNPAKWKIGVGLA
jgi:hypothetical protein